ncbi:cytochrome P450 [Cubamyces sp. BRFM 1775]|nr:cytochrome P450 [Cubamyces sp. BRFM 1775]
MTKGSLNACTVILNCTANSDMGHESPVHITLGVVQTVLCVLVVLIVRPWAKRKRCLPPGPLGLPLLGNMYDISQDAPWVAYRDLAAKYGDVICVQLVGHPVIVLNSAAADADLLEKRSAIYSDRPNSLVSVSRLLHWIWMFSLKPYDDDWRHSRRLLWLSIQPSAVARWYPIQMRESRRFLQYLLKGDRDLQEAIRLSLCRTLLSAAFGLPAAYVDERYVKLLKDVDDTLTLALDPAVLFIPFLRYLPSWFPGGGWKLGMENWRAQADRALEIPYKDALQAMKHGDAEPSLLNELLDGSSTSEQLEEERVKAVCSTMFVAGADATVSSLYASFCAMVLHPEVQQRAQEELDAIIGPDRLPEHVDKTLCPYTSALIKELLRWHPVSPLGVAHRCTGDNIYGGWTIPENATVMTNIWAILHDPKQFPEPDRFCPERFLKEGKLDTED